MFDSVQSFFTRRRRTMAVTAGAAGGAYMLGQYIMRRLEDVKEQVLQSRAARENLRRRFTQNQEDCAFTVLTLLPALGNNILEAMDVERLTVELQGLARSKHSPTSPPPPPPSNAASEPEHDATSVMSGSGVFVRDPETTSASSHSEDGAGTAQSWVEQFSAQEHSASASSSSAGAPRPASAASDRLRAPGPGDSPASLAASIVSERSDVSTDSGSHRSKAALWREVKMLAFSRAITLAHCTALLALLTHVQLSLLGRAAYLASLRELRREEAARESRPPPSVAGLFFDFALRPWPEAEEQAEDDAPLPPQLSEDAERAFLSMSWWLINVGWRDVAARVRAAVEEVFDGVSLKVQLRYADLISLLDDVRQRLVPSRHELLASLLPPTPADLTRLLAANGLPGALSGDVALGALLAEGAAFLRGADGRAVLGAALARADAALDAALARELFAGPAGAPAPAAADERARLAGMLPGVAHWCHAAVHGYPNELIDSVAAAQEMAAFCAIVYSSWASEFAPCHA